MQGHFVNSQSFSSEAVLNDGGLSQSRRKESNATDANNTTVEVANLQQHCSYDFSKPITMEGGVGLQHIVKNDNDDEYEGFFQAFKRRLSSGTTNSVVAASSLVSKLKKCSNSSLYSNTSSSKLEVMVEHAKTEALSSGKAQFPFKKPTSMNKSRSEKSNYNLNNNIKLTITPSLPNLNQFISGERIPKVVIPEPIDVGSQNFRMGYTTRKNSQTLMTINSSSPIYLNEEVVDNAEPDAKDENRIDIDFDNMILNGHGKDIKGFPSYTLKLTLTPKVLRY